MTKERLEKLCSHLKQDEGFLITSQTARHYVTGFKSSAGTVLLAKDQSFLFIDSRYYEKAAATVKNMQVILAKKTYEQIKEKAVLLGLKSIFCETDELSLAEYKKTSEALAPIYLSTDSKMNETLLKLRTIKDKDEIALIKSAQDITDRAFDYILNFITPGVTERQIALELDFFMRREGSEGTAFETICVSGKNSSLPHGVPTDKPVESGDFITMDFGARVGGYCADMTRTVAVGFVSEEQEKVYNTVLSAQLKALKALKAGAIASEVDAAARDIIAQNGYGEFFGHGLGHSLGIEIHESPACTPSCKEKLKAGMLMTVEPGIYIPGRFGVRIEDLVLIGEKSIKNLTHSKKELIIL